MKLTKFCQRALSYSYETTMSQGHCSYLGKLPLWITLHSRTSAIWGIWYNSGSRKTPGSRAPYPPGD